MIRIIPSSSAHTVTEKEGIFICTAIAFTSGDRYFGRNLDWEQGFGECITLTPRRFPLRFRTLPHNDRHHAFLGMARVAGGFPLYFDGVNEHGLAVAGLRFSEAHYAPAETLGLASFEVIPYLLALCKDLAEAREALRDLPITGLPFAPDLPPAPLHWFLADAAEALTLEVTERGVELLPNRPEVLANAPDFSAHLQALERLRLREPLLEGLPGDFTSLSRFIRAAELLRRSEHPDSDWASVNQVMHLLSAVERPFLKDSPHRTRYVACANVTKATYYYKTYEASAVSAVRLHAARLNAAELSLFPLITEPHILWEPSSLTGFP